MDKAARTRSQMCSKRAFEVILIIAAPCSDIRCFLCGGIPIFHQIIDQKTDNDQWKESTKNSIHLVLLFSLFGR